MVGESGCGKTTFGRSIMRLIEPTAGTVTFRGEDVLGASPQRLRQLRRSLQIVFQDPFASLNPRMPVRDIVAEPLVIHGTERRAAFERVDALLASVGLSPEHGNRYPHEFSGGQRQRIGIARALALDPEFVVLDEPVSALDVSVQAQVINLLEDLQDRLGLTYLMIAHDLSVVRHVADRVAVMYLGHLVELADAEQVYASPAHPYTHALLSAGPGRRPALRAVAGAHHARGGPALPRRPAVGLPVPDPLPDRPAGLCGGAPAARPGRRRPARRLPLPADGRRDAPRPGRGRGLTPHALGSQRPLRLSPSDPSPARARHPAARVRQGSGPARRHLRPPATVPAGHRGRRRCHRALPREGSHPSRGTGRRC